MQMFHNLVSTLEVCAAVNRFPSKLKSTYGLGALREIKIESQLIGYPLSARHRCSFGTFREL